MDKAIEVILSPNARKGRILPISCVVIHATETASIDSPLAWLCDPKSQASAHYLIGKDGRTIQLVDEADTAWHAGESKWRGLEHINPKTGSATVNPCSVGIEIVNLSNGKDIYPADQFAAAVALTAEICLRHGVKLDNVVGHEDIAPGRKKDPGTAFNWIEFRARLYSLGVG